MIIINKLQSVTYNNSGHSGTDRAGQTDPSSIQVPCSGSTVDHVCRGGVDR